MAKKEKKAPENPSTAWQGTFGDMITLMLCFFVMLYDPSDVIGPFDTADELSKALDLSGIDWTPVTDPPDLPNVNY